MAFARSVEVLSLIEGLLTVLAKFVLNRLEFLLFRTENLVLFEEVIVF